MADYTPNTYTGDGSTTTFAVTFDYIDQDHVYVNVDDVDTSFSWVTAGSIEISPAPDSGADIEIYRNTSHDALVTFTAGATLPERLNKAIQQARYIAEEADYFNSSAVTDTETAQAAAEAAQTAAEAAQTGAETAETNAETAQTAAEAAQTAAEAAYDSFDDVYLGAKGSAPSVDNDGDALATGALYFNTSDNLLYTWNGSSWVGWTGPAGEDGADGDPGTPGTDGTDGVDGLDITWKGAWTTATSYEVNDAVSNNGNSYICKSAHTSAGTDEPGVGANTATYWDLMASKGAAGAGTGDMLASTYDPGAISEQLVGLTATQTLTNKTIDGDNNTVTNLTTSAIVSGTFADARIAETSVTQHEAALSIGWSQITGEPSSLAGYGITDAYTDTEVDVFRERKKDINTQTGTSYTLVAADAGKIVEMNNAAANTLTVPPNSSVAFDLDTTIDVVQYGAGVTTIAAGAGVTIRSKDGNLVIDGQYAGGTLYKRGTDEWVLIGALTS